MNAPCWLDMACWLSEHVLSCTLQGACAGAGLCIAGLAAAVPAMCGVAENLPRAGVPAGAGGRSPSSRATVLLSLNSRMQPEHAIAEPAA